MTPPDDPLAVKTASQESWTEAVLFFLMLISCGANRYAILKVQEEDPDHTEVTTNSYDIRAFCDENDVKVVPLKDFRADGNSHVSIMTSIKPTWLETLDIEDPEGTDARYEEVLKIFKYQHGRDSYRNFPHQNGFATLPSDILEGIRNTGCEEYYQLRGTFGSNMRNNACYALMSGKPVYQRLVLAAHPVYEHDASGWINWAMFMSKRCWTDLFLIDTKATIDWNYSPYFKKVMWRRKYSTNTTEYENVTARIAGTQECWHGGEACQAQYRLRLMEDIGENAWNITSETAKLVAFPEEDLYASTDEYAEIPTTPAFSCGYKGPVPCAHSGIEYVQAILEGEADLVRESFARLYELTGVLPQSDIDIITANYRNLCERIPWACSH